MPLILQAVTPPAGGMTSGRVEVASSATRLVDYSNFTYDGNILKVGTTLDVAVGGSLSIGTGIATSIVVGGANVTGAIQALSARVAVQQNVMTTPVAALSVAQGAHSAITAGNESITFYSKGSTATWATGALASQRYNYFEQPTIAFAGASTVTTAATVCIQGAPIQGANATLTATYALWVNAGNSFFGGSVLSNTHDVTSGTTLTIGATANEVFLSNASQNWIRWTTGGVGAPAFTTRSAGTKLVLYPNISGASLDYAIGIESSFLWLSSANGFKFYGNNATTALSQISSAGAYLATAGNLALDTIAGGSLQMGTATATSIIAGNSANTLWDARSQQFLVRQQVVSTGTPPGALVVFGAAHTGLAAAEALDVNFSLNRTVTFAGSVTVGAANIATQRAVIIQAPTYAFGSTGAQTITNAVTLEVLAAPVAGANATLTNRWAFRSMGNMYAQTNAGSTAGVLQMDDTIGTSFKYAGNGIISTAQNTTIVGVAQAAQAGIALTVTAGAHTNLPTTVENIDVNFNLARTVQWATGTIATQRAMRIQAPTYAFVGASTITTASTVSISGAPIQGTNATITNAYALNLEAGNLALAPAASILNNAQGATNTTGLTIAANVADGASSKALVINNATTLSTASAKLVSVQNNGTEKAAIYESGDIVSATGWFGFDDANNAFSTTSTSGRCLVGGAVVATFDTGGVKAGTGAGTFYGNALDSINSFATITIGGNATHVTVNGANLTVQGVGNPLTLTQSVVNAAAAVLMTVTGAAHTALPASTENIDVNFNLARTVQFAAGALTTQRSIVIQPPTYTFVSNSTITTAATVAITGAPVASTGATITNSYALWVTGGTRHDADANYPAVAVNGHSTSTKAQKLHFDSAGNLRWGVDAIGLPSLGVVWEERENWLWFYNSGATTAAGTTAIPNSATKWYAVITNGTGTSINPQQTAIVGANYPAIPLVQIQSGTNASNIVSLAGGSFWLDVATFNTLYAVFEWDAFLSDAQSSNLVNVWMGLGQTSRLDGTGVNGMCFRKLSGTAYWEAVTGDGSAITTTTSVQVTPTTNTPQHFRIEWYGSATRTGAKTAKFYVNNTLIATHTTNMPTGRMLPAFEASPTSTTNVSLYVGVVHAWCNLYAAPPVPA